MLTFAELYCARNSCSPHEFQRRVFWRTLHWHAVLLAPLLMISDYFESDQELIEACARATRMKQIHEEIRDKPVHLNRGHWLHRHANLRISTRRLRRLAARYLAKSRSPAGRSGPGDEEPAARVR